MEEPTRTPPVPEPHPPSYLAERCSILAVDDEPSILVLLEAQLGREFDVRLAASAAEARDLFQQAAPDILLSDLTLPDSSGVQLLDWARRTFPRTVQEVEWCAHPIWYTGPFPFHPSAEAILPGLEVPPSSATEMMPTHAGRHQGESAYG